LAAALAQINDKSTHDGGGGHGGGFGGGGFVGSTVEDFTEDFTADFTDVRLQGLALDPTTTDTIPARTTTTTTMAVATSSVAA
jgi:hypothetical protein